MRVLAVLLPPPPPLLLLAAAARRLSEPRWVLQVALSQRLRAVASAAVAAVALQAGQRLQEHCCSLALPGKTRRLTGGAELHVQVVDVAALAQGELSPRGAMADHAASFAEDHVIAGLR